MNLQKPPRPIRDRKHLAFVASLPCCISEWTPVQAHHLLRTPEKAMGRRSGDNHVIPLHWEMHQRLHSSGNETRFLESHGIDGPVLAKALYEATGDYERACAILRGLTEEKAS